MRQESDAKPQHRTQGEHPSSCCTHYSILCSSPFALFFPLSVLSFPNLFECCFNNSLLTVGESRPKAAIVQIAAILLWLRRHTLSVMQLHDEEDSLDATARALWKRIGLRSSFGEETTKGKKNRDRTPRFLCKADHAEEVAKVKRETKQKVSKTAPHTVSNHENQLQSKNEAATSTTARTLTIHLLHEAKQPTPPNPIPCIFDFPLLDPPNFTIYSPLDLGIPAMGPLI
jgi:hypothetical protein